MHRKPGIICIMLALVIVLAHALIPHHHHNARICIDLEDSHNGWEAHMMDFPEQKHSHDGKGSLDDCILNQAIVLPSTPGKWEITDEYPVEKVFHQLLFPALIPQGIETYFTFQLLLEYPPGIADFSRSSLPTFSLRAPPLA